MAAKIESPCPSSKLSPNDRLARKRAAARLRQQRCRARKRQAMLHRRRVDDTLPQFVSQDSADKPTTVETEREIPPVTVAKQNDVRSSSQSGPIYNCVSFDSSRSLEDAQRPVQSPPQLKSQSSSEQGPISPQACPVQTKKPLEIVTVSQSQRDDTLVAEEEAAIAAMLSLKSAGSSSGPSAPVPVTPTSSSHHVATKPSPKPSNYRYYREWDRYDPYGYGRHGCAPAYYNMGMAHRVPPPHYRYYPAFPKAYSRFEYE